MRKFILLLLVGLLLSGIPVLAQDTPPVFCGDLSEADCAVLNNSAAAMRELRSAVMNFEVGISAANLPDTRPDSISLRLSGVGSFSMNGSTELFTNPNALLENPEALPQALSELLRSISGDLSLTIFFDENLIELASQGNGDLPQKAGLSARLVEGFAYLNLSKLAELDTSGTLPRGWVGVDLATVVQRALEEVLSQGIDFAELNTNPMDPQATLELMSAYTSIERLQDVTVEGQNAAVFQTTIDIAGLFSSPEYRELLIQQFEQMDAPYSDADLDTMMDMIGAIYGGFTISTTQTIGLDDYYVYNMSADLNWPFDFGALLSTFGDDMPKQPAIELSLNAAVNLSQFNNAPEIVPPEDATILSVEEALRQLGLDN